jgi:hypothetical protein
MILDYSYGDKDTSLVHVIEDPTRTSERMIRSVAQILRAMCQPDQQDWYTKIPMAGSALNSGVGLSTKS